MSVSRADVAAKQRAALDLIDSDPAWVKDAAMLHPQQLAAVRRILDPERGATPHYVIGQGGTGKSHVIHFVIRAMEAVGGRVQPICSFGQAADRIGGKTIHSAFGIFVKEEKARIPDDVSGATVEEYMANLRGSLLGREIEEIVSLLRSPKKRNNLSLLESAHLFIIDEVMSVSPVLFTVLHGVMAGLGLESSVAAFGDPMQITAPEGSAKMSTVGELLLKKMVYVFETPIWNILAPTVSILGKECNRRFEDGLTQRLAAALVTEDYNMALDENGTVLQDFINSRVEPDVSRLPDDTRALSFTHDGNNMINAEMARRVEARGDRQCIEFETVPMCRGVRATTLSQWHEKQLKARPDMTLAVGMPVHFVVNDPREGYYNGTPAVVEAFNRLCNDPDNQYSVTVRLTGEGARNRLITVGLKETHPNSNGETIRGLPFVLSFSRVVSAAQGCQYEKGVRGYIHGVPFASGLGAMAIMRFTNADGLMFSDPFPVDCLLLDPKARIFYELAAEAGPDRPCLYTEQIAAAKHAELGGAARSLLIEAAAASRKRKSSGGDDGETSCVPLKSRRHVEPAKRSTTTTVVPMQVVPATTTTTTTTTTIQQSPDNEDEDEFSNWPAEFSDAVLAATSGTETPHSRGQPSVRCNYVIH